jgi:hypothetical protein
MPAPGLVAVTETYNGSSYTEVNDLNTARESVWQVQEHKQQLLLLVAVDQVI